MSDSDVTRGKHRGLKPWAAGQSGNPAGRPKGARNRLGEDFLEAMHGDFAKYGVAAIVTVRETKPEQYLKVIASLLPRDLNVNIGNLDDMSDDDLVARIRQLDETIRPYMNKCPLQSENDDADDKLH